MVTILIRCTLLLVLVGFALPSVAQAQHYGHGRTHHSRSYGHHSSHHGYRPHYRPTYRRPTSRTHGNVHGHHSYLPRYRYSTTYRSSRRVYRRCR